MESNKKYYIYSHSNALTGEVFYIGMGKKVNKGEEDRAFCLSPTSRSKHWRKYYELCNKKIIINKIFFSNSISECSSKEKEFIEKYGRKINNTGSLVNISPGGDYINSFDIIEYDLEGNFIYRWDNIQNACDFYNLSYKAIYRALKPNSTCGKRQWIRVKKDDEHLLKISEITYSKCKKVNMFNMEGVFIKQFNSITEASLCCKINTSSIFSCVANKRPSAGNRIWSYNSIVNIKNKRIISQYSLDNIKIRDFNSLKEITDYLKIKSSTCIRQCIAKKQNQAYGYK